MGGVFDVMAAGHDEDAAMEGNHLDLRTIEAGEHRPGDHLLDPADRGMAIAEIENPVQRAQQRIQLMGAEQHGNLQFLLQAAHQLHHRALVMGIEADQRLVQQQQGRVAQQRLGQQQPLALAPGGLSERPAGEIARAYHLQSPMHVATAFGIKHG